MKILMWKRVIIDKETSCVANENLLGINEDWEKKTAHRRHNYYGTDE